MKPNHTHTFHPIQHFSTLSGAPYNQTSARNHPFKKLPKLRSRFSTLYSLVYLICILSPSSNTKLSSPMPGTIQVSVLEFVGLQSSSMPSQIFIKVSMGKIEYQTKDKGDFSFPLMTLRDNLIVTLQDREGKEISRAVVEPKLVIEKGVWDDTFLMEGVGHVHMRLQFILSEEDRQRIRTMRQTALKKKHDELLNNESGNPEYASSMANKVVSLCKNGKSGYRAGEGSHSAQQQNDTDIFRGTSSTTLVRRELKGVTHRSSFEKNEIGKPLIDVPIRTRSSEEASRLGSSVSVISEKYKFPAQLTQDGSRNTQNKIPLENNPHNVRDMISAFEGSANQDTRPKIRPSPIESQSSKNRMEVPSRSAQLDKSKPTVLLGKRFHTGNLQQAPIHIRRREKQLGSARNWDASKLEKLRASPAHAQTERTSTDFKNELKSTHKEVDIEEDRISSKDSMKAATSEGASVSGRVFGQLIHLARNLCAWNQHSVGILFANKSGETTQSKDSQEVKTPGASGHANYYSEHSGAWTFPDEGKHLCITAGGKQTMNLMGGFSAEAKNQPQKWSVCGGDRTEAKEGEMNSQGLRKPELERLTDDESSRGPVGQVMRVVIMVGFATLVLLTRQRKSDR